MLRNYRFTVPAISSKRLEPHTWAIPRLTGRAKTAMVKIIQADEYSGGVAADMQASLVRRRHAVPSALIRPTAPTSTRSRPSRCHHEPDLYVQAASPPARGAGWHLADFEMTYVGPMARYSAWAFRRLARSVRPSTLVGLCLII